MTDKSFGNLQTSGKPGNARSCDAFLTWRHFEDGRVYPDRAIQCLVGRGGVELDRDFRTCCVVAVTLSCRLGNKLKCAILDL